MTVARYIDLDTFNYAVDNIDGIVEDLENTRSIYYENDAFYYLVDVIKDIQDAFDGTDTVELRRLPSEEVS